MMALQTSNPFSLHSALSEEDAASVASLHRKAATYARLGLQQESWRFSARACGIVNHAMLQKMRDTGYEGEPLLYTEVPDEYPEQENVGLDLELHMIAGSSLAQKILALLEEDAERASII